MREEAPLKYSVPSLIDLGSLTELTLGNGGSSLDGTGLVDQRGKGNDMKPGLPVGGFMKLNGGGRGR